MASLSPTASDRLIYLGLGLATVGLVGVMKRMLTNFRNAAVLPPQPDIAKQIDQKVEDALKASTLDKLLDSTNYSIQEIASIIICERAVHEKDTLKTLMWYIGRPEYKFRERGIRALNLITNSGEILWCRIQSCANLYTVTLELINEPPTYGALVQCLEYCIDDYEHNEYDRHWDNWHLRDIVEQNCLQILSLLVDKYGVENLVDFDFIRRWLAEEPWGKNPQSSFLQSLASNDRLSPILRSLFLDPAARSQLKKEKLLSHHFSTCAQHDTRMVNGEGTAGEDPNVIALEGPRLRQRDQSMQEEHLRRRHRQAMVFNDGTRPFRPGDIIER